MVKELRLNYPKMIEKALVINFSLNKAVQPWTKGFSKGKVIKLHSLG